MPVGSAAAARPVMVGTDGSEESLQAVEWAAREAVLRRVPLSILSVLAHPLPEAPGWVRSGMTEQVARRAAARALALALERAADAAPGVSAGTGLITGAVAQSLAHGSAGATMLVVASRGAGGFSALALGSVSRYVATHTRCPVVVVREESTTAHGEIVVGVDGAEQSTAALGFAFEEAALRGARLLVVHAVFSFPLVVRALGALSGAERAELESRERQAEVARRLETALAAWREKFPRVQAGIDITDGHPGHVLAGESARADLVVLGRRARRGARGPGARAVTHAVLGHARGPVATVPGS